MWAAQVMVLGGCALLASGNVLSHTGVMGRQYYGGYSNNQGYTLNNVQQQQQQQHQAVNNNNNGLQATSDYNTLLQQYGLSPGFQDSYSTYGSSALDYTQDSYAPLASYAAGTVAAENPDSSPALSALALLGFLYFLNLIQDVLQNNNGRRRRSLHSGQVHSEEEEEEEGHYSTSYFEENQQLEDPRNYHPTDFGFAHQERAVGDEQPWQDKVKEVPKATPRFLSFLEDFFIKLPQALRLRSKKFMERDGRDENPFGIGSFITSRVKMISSIMSFLQNPSPSRVRRTIQADDQTKSSLLDMLVDLVGRDAETPESRKRRHTHNMNAWYRELGGRNTEVSPALGGMAAKVMSAMGAKDELQETVKKNALPAFLELTRSLDGTHPHCLQRALCRMNSHSEELPFISHLALQLLSNNLAEMSTSYVAEDNFQAIQAGQRGENCDQIFTSCGSFSNTKE